MAFYFQTTTRLGLPNLEVRDPDGWVLMWGKVDLSAPSATYNDDNTGQDLTEGLVYQWGVGALDDEGNSSWHYTTNTFAYSITGKPLLWQHWVGGRHRISPTGEDEYALHMQAVVKDPQGLESIVSVMALAPDNTLYTLYDDGNHADDKPNDGVYGLWVDWRNMKYATGIYTFTVTDSDNNTSSATDTMEGYPDAPTGLLPENGTVLFADQPVFSWNTTDFTDCWITVMDRHYNNVWENWNVNTTSISYGGPELTAGKIYRWQIGVRDAQGNEGQSEGGTFIYYPTRKIVDTYYDRFDGAGLDPFKWDFDGAEVTREISNGKLRLNAGGQNGRYQTTLHTWENDSIDLIEAKVTVESTSFMENGARGYARIAGMFYNDSHGTGSGMEYDGMTGDVWAEFKFVLDDENKLVLNAYVERSNDANFDTGTVLFDQNFPITYQLDTEYVISIEGNGDPKQIIFTCNGTSLAYDISTATYKHSGGEYYKLRTRVYDNPDADSYGKLNARFDDVYIDRGDGNGRVLYDDFENDLIDTAKWQDIEHIIDVDGGKLRLGIGGMDEKTTLSMPSAFNNSRYIEAKVMVESGSRMDPNIRGIARVSGSFYNDT